MGLATEVLSVRDEMEALMLSKDGKAVQISKVKDFPAKVEKLLLAIVSLKGSKTATPTEQTDEELAKKELERIRFEAAKKVPPAPRSNNAGEHPRPTILPEARLTP